MYIYIHTYIFKLKIVAKILAKNGYQKRCITPVQLH